MLLNEDYHINTFLSNDNITVNYDKWKSGEINKLFILGLMGASKSTTCRRLAKKYNCQFVEFDMFHGHIWLTDDELKKDHPLVYEYMKNVYETKYGSRMGMKYEKGELLLGRQTEFFYWILQKPERVIIEGLLSRFIEKDENLLQYPMILIGTSKLTSAFRMMKRQVSYQVHNWRNGYYDLGELKGMIMMLSRYEDEQENQNMVREKIMRANNGKYERLEESYNNDYLLEDYHINTLMSNKDVYLNFNKWRTGEINKCFIIGLSGSGKSVLGQKIAAEWNCYYIQLDRFRGNVWYTDEELKRNDPFIYEYFTKVWTHGDRHNISKLEPEDRREEFEKFVYWLLDRPERMVIDGALDRILMNNKELKQFPMIFKGTSMLKSMARMSWREFNREHPGRDPVDNLLWWMKWCTRYKNMTDQNNRVRENIMGGIDMDDYEEREENDLPLIIEAMGYKPQSIIFSDPDVYINYKKWILGECKTVLITSVSGSGKSTLAKKIAEKYKAYYVEIDIISFGIGVLREKNANWEYIKGHDKYFYKWLKENNLPPTLMLKFKDYQDIKKNAIIDKYIHWLCFERDDLDTNRVVIEGGDVAVALTNMEELSKLPIIIKGTSLSKSLFRRMQRTVETKDNGLYKVIKNIFDGTYVVQYNKMIPEVNNARRAVMDQEYDEIHESCSTFTHQDLCDIYDRQMMNESYNYPIPHKSGNITQYEDGAYFNRDINMWVRPLNEEEQARLKYNDRAHLREVLGVDTSFLDNEYI